MKPGCRVRAVLRLAEREDVITVPRQAVLEKDARKLVYRRRGDGFEAVAVKLGPASLTRVVVEEGLEPGDEVALCDPARCGGESRSASGRTPAGGPGRGGR